VVQLLESLLFTFVHLRTKWRKYLLVPNINAYYATLITSEMPRGHDDAKVHDSDS